MNDIHDLARQSAAVTARSILEERRRLWRNHHSLGPTRLARWTKIAREEAGVF